MAKPKVYKYKNPKSWKSFDCQLEIGLDTIRFGYFPHPISWHQGQRFKDRGWQFIPAKKSTKGKPPSPATWRKKHSKSGIVLSHTGPFDGFPGWVSVEGSLARMLQANNSSMNYDPEVAFAALKQWVDQEVLLEMKGFTRVSPEWSSWYVNRADVTGDFIFDRIENVEEIFNQLKGVTMPNRPRKFSKESGLKWTSKSNRIALSVYDKFEKDPLSINRGKLRVTIIFQDKNEKKHLGKYNMKSVKGLMVRAKWLKVLRDEVFKLRPPQRVAVLRLILNEAWKSQLLAGNK